MKARRSPTLQLAEDIAAARHAGQDVMSLSTPSFPSLNIPLNWNADEANKLAPASGYPPLVEQSEKVFFSRWNLPEHQVLITAGAKMGLFAALYGLLPKGSRVLVIAPTWPSYEDIIGMAGHQAHVCHTRFSEHFAIERHSLESAVADCNADAIMLSNPSNPTGRIYTGTELNTTLDIAEQAGAYLFLDESFSDVCFETGLWNASVTRPSNKLVLFNSFSKNFHLQGLRVAACFVQQELADTIVASHQTLISATPTPSQHIALHMIINHDPTALAREYAASREIATRILQQSGWGMTANSGTFYFFPQLPDPDSTRDRLRTAGLYSLGGAAFGSDYHRHIRFCFGKPEHEMLEIEQRMQNAGLLEDG